MSEIEKLPPAEYIEPPVDSIATADLAVAGIAQSPEMTAIITRTAHKRNVDPEALAQEVYIKALIRGRAGQLEMGSQMPGWISTVSNTTAIDFHRTHRHRWTAEISLDSDSGPPDPPYTEVNFATVERTSTINSILAGLNRQDREILDLHYLKDMSIARIAGSLSVSETAVKIRISTALRRARKAAKELELDKAEMLG